MRRFLLLVAVLSLAFAPAPFPRADRQTRETRQQSLMLECVGRLAELGVEWSVHELGERVAVQFTVNRPNNAGQMGGWHPTERDNLLATLQNVARQAERFLKGERVG